MKNGITVVSFACRFVNDVLHIRKREKELFRRAPIERRHGEIVVLTLTNSQLFFEVVKGIEFMISVKLLVVFSVATFHLSVMAGVYGRISLC